jgi:hypothetical protein
MCRFYIVSGYLLAASGTTSSSFSPRLHAEQLQGSITDLLDVYKHSSVLNAPAGDCTLYILNDMDTHACKTCVGWIVQHILQY